MEMIDVTGLGELLIDFTPAGNSSAGNALFERNPGGGTANVLAAVAKLGGESAFIGKVGNDQFGHFLKNALDECKIETHGLKFSDGVNTTIAFVHLDEKGDRSFSFYRKPGADTTLSEEDIEWELIDNAGIFQFGSLSMTDEPAKSATIKAAAYAKQKGRLISYDPNWRPLLWPDDRAAREGMAAGLKYADILKISEVEMEFLTGEADLEKGSRIFFDTGIRLVLITLGPRGCYYRHASGEGRLDTFNTHVVDTTGAGDAFLGGLLYKVARLEQDLSKLGRSQIEEMVDFANAVGALCASKRGGIPAMPSMQEVKDCIANVPRLTF